jgi:hypothetical protein
MNSDGTNLWNRIQPFGCQHPTFRQHVKYKCLPTHSLLGTTANIYTAVKINTTCTKHIQNHARLTTIHIINTNACPPATQKRITSCIQTQLQIRPNNELHVTGLPRVWLMGKALDSTSASQRRNDQLTSRLPTPMCVSIATCRAPYERLKCFNWNWWRSRILFLLSDQSAESRCADKQFSLLRCRVKAELRYYRFVHAWICVPKFAK